MRGSLTALLVLVAVATLPGSAARRGLAAAPATWRQLQPATVQARREHSLRLAQRVGRGTAVAHLQNLAGVACRAGRSAFELNAQQPIGGDGDG